MKNIMPVVMLRKTRCHGNSAGIDRCWFYLLGEASCRLIECGFGLKRGESFWIPEADSCNSLCRWCRHLGFVDGYHRLQKKVSKRFPESLSPHSGRGGDAENHKGKDQRVY